MKKITVYLMLVFALCSYAYSFSCSDYPNAIYCEDFENNNLENWTLHGGDENLVIENALGSKALKYSSSGGLSGAFSGMWINQSNYFNVSIKNISFGAVGGAYNRFMISHKHSYLIKSADLWYGNDIPDNYLYSYSDESTPDKKFPYIYTEVKNITYEIFYLNGICHINYYINGNFSLNNSCRNDVVNLEALFSIAILGSSIAPTHLDNILVCNDSISCNIGGLIEETPLFTSLYSPVSPYYTNSNSIIFQYNTTKDSYCSIYSNITGEFKSIEENKTGSYYKFEENIANKAYDNISGIHGTAYNSPQYVSSKSGNGTDNYALKFTGNEFINFSSFNFENNQAFSGSIWVNISTNATTQYIMGSRNIAAKGWGLLKYTDNTLRFILRTTALNSLYVYSSVLPNNRWTHIGFSYNGTNTPEGIKLYINGVSASISTSSNNLNGSILNSDGVQISGRYEAVSTFTGLLDNALLINRTLTPSEMLSIYNNGWDELKRAGITYNETSILEDGYDLDIEYYSKCMTAIEENISESVFVYYDDIVPDLYINYPFNNSVLGRNEYINVSCSDNNLLDFSGYVSDVAETIMPYLWDIQNSSNTYESQYFNISNSTDGEYKIFANCSDGHTKNDISRLEAAAVGEKIIYSFEDTSLSEEYISSSEKLKALKFEKKEDKIITEYEFDTKSKNFYYRKRISCNKPLRHIVSDYNAHFICGMIWIDEENNAYGSPEIVIIDEYSYELIINAKSEKIISKSVGLINYAEKTIYFYLDTTPPNISSVSINTAEICENQSFNIEYTPFDTYGIDNCSLYVNEVLNAFDSSIVNKAPNSFSLSLLNGSYNYTISCIDTHYNSNTSQIYEMTAIICPVILPDIEFTKLDYGQTANVLMLFVLLIAMMGMYIIGFVFKSFPFISFGFMIGIFLGFMLSSFHIWLTFVFFFLNMMVLFSLIKAKKF